MAESRQLFLCSYCEFRCYNHLGLLKHIRATHENDPNFRVYCSLCGKSYNKWCSFKKHLHRDHGTECAPVISNSTSIDYVHDFDQQEVAIDDYLDESDSFEDEKWKCAKFLLHVTEEHHLTHDGVTNLSNSVQWLVDSLFSQVKERISAHLSDTADVDKETILKMCEPGDIFLGLNTRHLREKFYKERFNFVEPTPILLGSNWEWVVATYVTLIGSAMVSSYTRAHWRGGTVATPSLAIYQEHGEQKLTQVKHYGYTIELQEGLQALLSNPSVRQEVCCSHHSTDGVLRDFCDAHFIKAHPVFTTHPDALQFILFYDDIEVANPLGAKAGLHKLGVFYYILGNIRPIFRSNLQNIQLVAIAKSADIKKYGCDTLLQPFIDQMNALGKEHGLSIQLQDQSLTLHGAVVCICGDIPASNYIGGFKEGVSFALRKCRRCLATGDDMRAKFHEAEFILRNLTEHKDYISLIEESEVHSVTYGINKASILQQLDNFDVTKCLPFDIMHTAYEGVAVYHLNLLLHYLIDTRKWLSLTELNHAIQAHHYGYTECDTKPNKINRGQTIDADFRIKSSASQMMTLIRLLPLMVGNYVERNDKHWECFLQLWDICSMVCAFEVTTGDAAHLAWLVEAYLEEFFILYDVTMTPKLHYLVHLPQQILEFGPLRHHWCMRFESKNAQIKRFLSPQSYKNVPLSVSIHHQMWMCYQLLTQPEQSTSNFLYSGDDIISGSQLIIDTHVEEICTLCGEESTSSSLLVLRANSIKIHGIHYKSGAVVRVAVQSDQSETFLFQYAKIKNFYIYKDHKIFTAQKLNVIGSNTHIRGIQVELIEDVLLFRSNDLYCHGVLHLKQQGLDTYLIEKDNRVKPTFFY